MLKGWDPINICLAGTQGIREESTRVLPQEPREDAECYQRRVYHAVLPPFLTRLAAQASGLILRKGITLEGDEFWQEWAKDVCGDGTTLNAFARRMLETSILYGHSSAIVDINRPANNRRLSLADQRKNPIKPYLVNVHPQTIRGFRTADQNPQGELDQVRIRELAVESKGRFGEEQVEQIRVLERGSYELYRKTPTGAWFIYESGETGLDKLPFFTIYSDRTGTLTSNPPLKEVAYMAISYCQRWTDYAHSLHVGAMPILTMRGFDPDAEAPLGISPNTAILLPDTGGAEFVSPTTDAFDSQLAALNALEDQINRLGINTLNKANLTNAAAEARRLDRIDSDSIMALISNDLQLTLTEMMKTAADYIGMEAPKVIIQQDYDNKLLDGNGTTALLQLYMQGVISQRTTLKALSAGEVLPAGTDIEAEIVDTRDFLMELNGSGGDGLDPLSSKPESLSRDNRAGQGEDINSQTLPTPMRPGKNP
jgi:hypothetical protein